MKLTGGCYCGSTVASRSAGGPEALMLKVGTFDDPSIFNAGYRNTYL